MTVLRVSVILAIGLATLLTVAALRERIVRLHYELSRLDAQAQSLRQELWHKELILARLRNPMLIRERLKELRVPTTGPATEQP